MRLIGFGLSCVAAAAFANSAAAADVGYSFSTGPASGFFSADNSSAALNIFNQLSGAAVSGSFVYDAASTSTGSTGPGGSLDTRGTVYSVTSTTPPFHSSFNTLSASVGGFSLNDPRGFTIVGNEAFQGTCAPAPCTQPPLVDFYSYQADTSSVAAGSVHNISGFSLNVAGTSYSLFNVRFIWIEAFPGQGFPPGVAPIPDFLSSNDLLATPPSYLGRIALDFVPTGNIAGAPQSVFFEGLSVAAAVPEPETYAMLMAGFGLLGFIARRRKRHK